MAGKKAPPKFIRTPNPEYAAYEREKIGRAAVRAEKAAKRAARPARAPTDYNLWVKANYDRYGPATKGLTGAAYDAARKAKMQALSAAWRAETASYGLNRLFG